MSKDRFLSVCMDPRIKSRLKEAAIAEKRTMSSICILILEGYLESLPVKWRPPSHDRKGKDFVGFRLSSELFHDIEDEAFRRNRPKTAICEMTFDYWSSLDGSGGKDGAARVLPEQTHSEGR